MEKIYNWLILKNIKGVGNKSLKKLYDYFGSAEEILNADVNTLSLIIGKEKALRIKNLEGVSASGIDRLMRLLGRWDINVICIEDEKYPDQLKLIPDPPPILYFMGELKKGAFIGIVGSRHATMYSLDFTDIICRHITTAGFYTVSGGARGIDTKVHESTLKYGGYTVWVAGTGLLNVDINLKGKILSKGSAVISEFDPLEKGSKYTFSQRNRLISALSEILVIVEAGIKSGSLITARYAIKQGKRVFVHIGIGRSERWAGCYMLLKEGKAELFKDPEELVEALSYSSDKYAEEQDIVEIQSSTTDESILDENIILSVLETPKTFDQILMETGLQREELLGLLSILEIEGKIKKSGIYYMVYNS